MQGLADGYFVIPYTIGPFLSKEIRTPKIDTNLPEFEQAERNVRETLAHFLSMKGNHTVDSLHRKLGLIIWDYCGMARNEQGLKKALDLIAEVRQQFWSDLFVPGSADEFNPELEKAGRVADFIELGDLMIRDALNRNESCGGHFREEYSENGEAKRDDENYTYVAAWEYTGEKSEPGLHKEQLVYENIELKTRSYV